MIFENDTENDKCDYLQVAHLKQALVDPLSLSDLLFQLWLHSSGGYSATLVSQWSLVRISSSQKFKLGRKIAMATLNVSYKLSLLYLCTIPYGIDGPTKNDLLFHLWLHAVVHWVKIFNGHLGHF